MTIMVENETMFKALFARRTAATDTYLRCHAAIHGNAPAYRINDLCDAADEAIARVMDAMASVESGDIDLAVALVDEDIAAWLTAWAEEVIGELRPHSEIQDAVRARINAWVPSAPAA